MIRKILSVILGYILMVVFIMLTFSAAYLLMGTERAFRPDSFEVTSPWIITSIVLGLIAAIAGGWVCAAIARDARVPMVLAGLVFVLGIAMAIPTLTTPDQSNTDSRAGNLENFEAMQKARQPAWIAFLNPIIGAAGVMIGSRLKRDLEPEG